MTDAAYHRVCRDIFDSASNKQGVLEVDSFKPFMINIAKAAGEDPKLMEATKDAEWKILFSKFGGQGCELSWDVAWSAFKSNRTSAGV